MKKDTQVKFKKVIGKNTVRNIAMQYFLHCHIHGIKPSSDELIAVMTKLAGDAAETFTLKWKTHYPFYHAKFNESLRFIELYEQMKKDTK